MRRTNNAWRRLRESVEGPTVNLQLPRELADMLLQQIAAGLEVDDEMMGDDDMDLGGEEPDADDLGGMPDGDEDDMPFSMGDEDEEAPGFSAGDDDGDMDDMLPAGDEDEDEPAPGKRGPGRPPGSKNKKKSEPKKGEKKPSKEKDDDSDEEEEQDEGVSNDPADTVRPGTAFGESRRRRPVLSSFIRPSARRR